MSKVPLLTAREERELATQVRLGDMQSGEKMLRTSHHQVVSITKNSRNRGLSFMDLMEEGNVGLLKAVEQFDPDEEFRI